MRQQPERTPLEVDLHLSNQTRDALYATFETIRVSPYRDYPTFMVAIRACIAENRLPAEFMAACADAKSRDQFERPFFSMRNCPIDRELPVFDTVDPVQSKYALKKTFIGEAFLLTYAELTGTPALSYKNVNDGDIVHDIFPKESLYNTQSQKTLLPIGFHKDLANHFVRPDHVNILGMRSHPANEIYTTFVRNADLLSQLPAEVIETLRRKEFYTPFDDLSVDGDKDKVLGRADDHAVIRGRDDFAYFEKRTVGHTEAARAAVIALDEALHRLKKSVLMRPGDFVSISNNYSLHGKDVVQIRDPEQQKIRWSIKTVNANSLATHEQHYVPGQYGVVNG